MDRDDFIITVYCLVCEHYQVIQGQYALRRGGFVPALTDEEVITREICGEYVRRITARAIPPTGRMGSEGNPWVNNSPRGESQQGQEHVSNAERLRRRVWSGSARPVC